MIIQCDACQTRFKLPDEKLKPGGVKVRCTKCEQIFQVPGPQPEDAPTADPAPEPVKAAPPADSSELDFSDIDLGGSDAGTTDAVGAEFDAGAEPEGEEFDFDEFNMEDLATDDDPAVATESPDGSELPTATEPAKEAVKDIGDELPDFDLPEDYSFDAEESAASDPLADFSPEELSKETDELDSGSEEPTEEPLLDDIFGDEESASSAPDFSIEEDEPTIGGDLGKTFEMDADLSDLPDLDQEDFGTGTSDEFSFDNGSESEADSGLGALDNDDAGPVEFSFGDETESDDQAVALEDNQTGADDFIFEQESATAPPQPATRTSSQTASPAPVEAAEKPSSAPKPAVTKKRRKAGNARVKKRKKGNRTLPLFLLLLAVIGGAYAYLGQQRGTYDPQVLFSYVKQMVYQEPLENPTTNIELKNLRSSFVSNQNAGQLFAISGEAVNKYATARSTIAVKGMIYNAAGEAVMQQTVFCGNPLDEAALRTLPFAKIEETMNNQFGDSLSNLDVAPGSSVPFTIVFKNLPSEVAEFNVEVADSRPGTQ